MGQYSKKGLYAGYKKNNIEREALDYYATPPEEVTNILNHLGVDLSNKTILEPCVGGGHMWSGVLKYLDENNTSISKAYLTDVQDRNPVFQGCSGDVNTELHLGSDYDFLKDDYPFDKADVIIMNPPYSTIEPFVIRALEIAPTIIMLARNQFSEGEKRYEKILKDTPPQKVIQYVDRIACYKNGDFSKKLSSSQAYSWFVWDKENLEKTSFEWIRRFDKIK